MSYISLARKYRPRFFKDLLGQEAVSKALINAMKLKREPAAVIFSGIRGIGKTTSARIYAKALNCNDHSDSEPCDHCDSCSAIDSGNHEDVTEIDGASHNGVDEIRTLKESVSYKPQRSSHKVYIIDEVHMLSVNAFNALLKTLEEPPKNVVFILATTELHKVPDTIVGRCQTFYLNKIPSHLIIRRIREILDHESISFDEDSLRIIARQGQGSMRDALTFLDQAIALGQGSLSSKTLESMLASVSSSSILELLQAIISKDMEKIITLIEQLDQGGCEFRELTDSLAQFTRNAFIIKSLTVHSPNIKQLNLSDFEIQILTEIANSAAPLDLNRFFRSLVASKNDMDGSEWDRFIFENYCLEWCLDPGLPLLHELLNKTKPLKQGTNQDVRGLPHGIIATQTRTTTVQQKSTVISNDKQNVTSQTASGDTNSLTQRFAELTQDKKKIPVRPITPAGTEKQKINSQHTTSFALTPSATGTETELLPKTWRELVHFWKETKPLEGRKLEEVYELSYSPTLIKLGVKQSSMMSQELMSVKFQGFFKSFLEQTFRFKGHIKIELLTETGAEKISQRTTLLQEKISAEEQRKKDLREKAINHPATRAVIEKFGASVQGIEYS